eukprot:TRINITY_DN66396_c9_g1_i1.p1 TRINITY_DN66396_c9_g1~~TRINITY_DN66396_c9_g1_i1.p1  ORF type:complete len:581 (-),score=273.54 TRINITY_DN66396_c9_g1_i1:1180-2922(-)
MLGRWVERSVGRRRPLPWLQGPLLWLQGPLLSTARTRRGMASMSAQSPASSPQQQPLQHSQQSSEDGAEEDDSSPYGRAKTLFYDRYDIVCVGGGIVGSIFAALLASNPMTSKLRIAVLESSPPPEFYSVPDVPDLRVAAIAPSSRRCFEQAGVWERIEHRRVGVYTDMHVWDTTSDDAHVHWAAEEYGVSELGHVVENNNMQFSLFERLTELSTAPDCGVDVLAPAKVTRLQMPSVTGSALHLNANPGFATRQNKRTGGSGNVSQRSNSSSMKRRQSPNARLGGDFARVTLDGGRVITAKLVVGADGANSFVRKASGIESIGFDYNQMGVVATVRTDAPHTTAWQRFTPDGPLSLMPIDDTHSSVVWSNPTHRARELCGVPKQKLIQEMNDLFAAPPQAFRADGRDTPGSFLPPQLRELMPVLFPTQGDAAPRPPQIVDVVGKPAMFPLKFAHVKSYVRPRLALLGDAAHTIHPVAGQGLNLGIADAKALADIVVDGVTTGQDLGSLSLLQAYSEQQLKVNMAKMTAMSGILTAFTVQSGPFAFARELGLHVFNNTPALKDFAAATAMGIELGKPVSEQ